VSCVGNSPVVDDTSFASALSRVCSIEGCLEEVMSRLESIGLGDVLEKDACACRCAEVNGCQMGKGKGGEKDSFERATCTPAYVDGGCEGAFKIEGVKGEEAAFARSCGVSTHTCQQYGWTRHGGVCSPFVSADTLIFVPAGETIDSLEGYIKALLFEAALVSSACFKAHGDLMCNMRLKRCRRSASDGPALPERLCRQDCVENANARDELCHLPVFNSKWNSDEQVAEGFTTAFMCDGTVSTSMEPLVCSNGTCPLNFPQYEWIRAADFLAFDTVGKPMFPDAGCVGLHERVTLVEEGGAEDGNLTRTTYAFSIPRALDVIQCPYPFKKNTKASVEGLRTNEGVHSRFCVVSCPTTIYSDTENRVLWAAYVIPGSIATFMNFPASFSLDNKVDVMTRFMIIMGMLYGIFGTLPSLFLFDEVPCICDTEDCFHIGPFCKLSSTTTFILQSILLSLWAKMYHLALKLKHLRSATFQHSVTEIVSIVVVASGLCIAGFILDDDAYDSDQYNLHLARSAFSCKMRFESFKLECCIMHLPLLIAASGIVLSMSQIFGVLHANSVRLDQHELPEALQGQHESASDTHSTSLPKLRSRSLFEVLLLKKNHNILTTLLLGGMTASILVLTTVNTITSAPLFISYNRDYFKWCVSLHVSCFVLCAYINQDEFAPDHDDISFACCTGSTSATSSNFHEA
jgi:hypothetical protein